MAAGLLETTGSSVGGWAFGSDIVDRAGEMGMYVCIVITNEFAGEQPTHSMQEIMMHTYTSKEIPTCFAG